MWTAIGVVVIAALMFLQNYELVFTGIGKIIALVASLLYGVVIAFVVNLLMRNLEKVIRFGPFRHKKARRIVCMILSFLILFGAIAAIIACVWPQLKDSIKLLIEKMPGALDFAIEFCTTKLNMPAEWFENIDDLAGEDLMSKLLQTDLFNTILSSGGKIIGIAFDGVMNFLIGLCFSLYLLISKESVIRSIKSLCRTYMKKERAERLIKLGTRMNAIYTNFISGQVIDAIILGTMVAITLAIFRIPYAILIGVVVAVTAIIPIAGAFIGGGIGAFLLLMISPKQAIIFLIIFIVLQQIDNHLIYPHVVGRSVGLPPIWIFIAVIVGGNIAGVVGMVLMIPIVALIYALHHENAAIVHELEEEAAAEEAAAEAEVRAAAARKKAAREAKNTNNQTNNSNKRKKKNQNQDQNQAHNKEQAPAQEQPQAPEQDKESQ